jgi:rhomboid family GlyGly-CTERM serine protease
VAEGLQYDRVAVAAGEIWRLATGQLVHWTPRMAAIDLLVLGIAGGWVETRSRRLLAWTVALSAVLVGLAIQGWTTDLATYRGSSGIASGLYAAVACTLLAGPARPWVRALAVLALTGLIAKAAVEAATGVAVFAGPLPAGVVSVPEAHLAGALAGILAAACRGARRRAPGGRPAASVS